MDRWGTHDRHEAGCEDRLKQAVKIAKEKAAEILVWPESSLEEIERESYKDRDVWSITLSLPPVSPDALQPPMNSDERRQGEDSLVDLHYHHLSASIHAHDIPGIVTYYQRHNTRHQPSGHHSVNRC
jgi:hypothetical protein